MRFPTMWYVRPSKAQISLRIMTMTMTMDLFQLRAHEGQKIIGEILHTTIEHN